MGWERSLAKQLRCALAQNKVSAQNGKDSDY